MKTVGILTGKIFSIFLLTFWLNYSFTNAQNFEDDFSIDHLGSLPVNWNLINGYAEVASIEGNKGIFLKKNSIVSPKIGNSDYLTDDFTLQFKAFFDQNNNLRGCWYGIRLWPGTTETPRYDNENGKGSYSVLKIYRHGVDMRSNDETNGNVSYLNLLENNLANINAVWRTLVIIYKQRALKVTIDGIEVLNLLNYKLVPQMISIEGRAMDGYTPQNTLVSSVRLTGIKNPSTFNNSDDSNSGLGDLTQPSINEASITTTEASGLEAIDEGNGIGWRLIGSDSNNFGNVGAYAVDLSQNVVPSTSYGATGNHSTAMGTATTASGSMSTAIGSTTIASGILSTAIGFNSIASGYNSIAIGYNTRANSYKSTAFGNRNIGGGNPDVWVETDPLFEIGNGTQTYLANAFTVLKNGTIVAPSFDITEITDPKALITKEYADANYSNSNVPGSSNHSTGLEAVDEGNGIGWRLNGRDPNNYGRIATGAVDLSISNKQSSSFGATGNYSIAFGQNNIASGNNSTAMGYYTIAGGNYSTAMGENSKALANYSFATGLNAEASGINAVAIGHTTLATNDNAIAFGINTIASGSKSMAFGNTVKAVAPNSVAIGYKSIASGEGSTAMGNETKASGMNSTALGFKNEATGFSSVALANETIASGFSATAMGFQTIADDQFCTVVGRLNDNTTTTTSIFQVGNGTSAGRSNAFTIFMNGNGILAGSLSQTSDARLKNDINELNYGLNEILQLKPKCYYLKDAENEQKSIGLIAQDVRPIISEIVFEEQDEDKTLSLNYTALIPVLIKAMQEQQKIIEEQNIKIDELSTSLNVKDETITDLNVRVNQIETLLKQEKL